MGIPTTGSVPDQKTSTNPLPMQGEMKKKLDQALNDLKDVYGDEGGDSGGEQSDENGQGGIETGIKLHPMPDTKEPEEETYELKTNLPPVPPKPKPTNLDDYQGVDAEAKDRIRRMIAQSRSSTAKMKEVQVKMAA